MSDLVNALSGKSGDAYKDSTRLEITGWKATPVMAAPKYASNLTDGHKVAVGAVEDITGGEIMVVVGTGGLVMNNGDIVELSLYGPISMVVTALITSHPIEIDVNDGNPTMLGYTFEPRGRPVFGNSASAYS